MSPYDNFVDTPIYTFADMQILLDRAGSWQLLLITCIPKIGNILQSIGYDKLSWVRSASVK